MQGESAKRPGRYMVFARCPGLTVVLMALLRHVCCLREEVGTRILRRADALRIAYSESIKGVVRDSEFSAPGAA